MQRAAHALARLLALVAPRLERLKGPWEHPLYIVALTLALTHRPALSFPELEAFDMVCTDDDMLAYRMAMKTTAHQAGQGANKDTPHPFFMLLTKHAGRFPALSHLRFATEWAGENGWSLPFVAQPSLLLRLVDASVAPQLTTLELDTAFVGELMQMQVHLHVSFMGRTPPLR